MRRLLTIIGFLTCCLLLYAGPEKGRDAAEAALAEIDRQIADEQRTGDVEKESLARWQKILTLKNFSLMQELMAEAEPQMEWFSSHGQWDNYYRTWQLKANTLSAQGKLQQSLQETQRMLNDAKERNNKLGRAMAYKQIGIIYLNMKQTEPAVEALQHYAELMKDEDGDINSLSNIYYRMAKAYDYDKAYDKELRVTGEWLKFLIAKVGKQDRPDIRECYNACYLAKTAALIGLKRMKEAEGALDTAVHHGRLIKTPLSLHHSYKMQARYYLAKGEAAKALLFADSVSMTTSEKDDHTEEVRAQALIMLGRGEEAALIYQRLYHEKDSVFGHDARQHLDELNTLFQLDELKTEQQRTRFKYTLLTAFSIVLALLLLLLHGWRSAIRHKKANEQLRIANEQAKVSSRMKSEFIRNISHEIRTPLNIISGFAQILTAPDMNLPEDQKTDIQQRITENSKRITRLVDGMLDLSDLNSETIVERHDRTDVLELVTQAIDGSKITLNTRPVQSDSAILFETDINETVSAMPLLTNKRYVIRILVQLLENAMKFTKEGRIVLRAEATDDTILFSVEDTGIGIPADQTENIFGEFVQLDSFVDGTGIGLTIGRSIARRMGGDLWLDTHYTQGARFVLELLIK